MSTTRADRLKEAVERYGAAVLQRCRGFTRDPHLAEDMSQEVFARLCAVIGDTKRVREDVSWSLVEGILRNVILEHLRRKRKMGPLLEIEPDTSVCGAQGGGESRDGRGKLQALVEQLHPREQQTVLGHHLLGMTMAELTRFMELPRSTVVDCYKKGIMRLRRMAKDRGLLP